MADSSSSVRGWCDEKLTIPGRSNWARDMTLCPELFSLYGKIFMRNLEIIMRTLKEAQV